MTPVDVARAWCTDLAEVGLRATTDPRKILPPCVLIRPPRILLDRLDLCGTAEWSAYLLAATGVGDTDAWTQLDGMLVKALPLLPVTEVDVGSYEPDEATSYPAYVLTWTSQVEFTTA
jgi:hypothetical protein